MKRCYLAGPYRDSRGEWFVQQNIEHAGEVARKLWRDGFSVMCPHKNTSFYGGTDIPDQIWLDGDLEWIKVSDILVLMPDWERSSGTRAEKEFAEKLGIPVYVWPNVPRPEDVQERTK
ncbi:MAG: DUF1937 family protein [Acidobacteriia bacterium]|nr:DUF1937 family protein [Terriglobia bacterium]